MTIYVSRWENQGSGRLSYFPIHSCNMYLLDSPVGGRSKEQTQLCWPQKSVPIHYAMLALCTRSGKRKHEISKWGRGMFWEESIVDKCHWVWKEILLFLSCLLLYFPHTCSHTHGNTCRQLNKILEAPVCFQVNFGVGGDFSLRLYSPFPPPKMFLILQTQQTLWLGGGRRYFSSSEVSW